MTPWAGFWIGLWVGFGIFFSGVLIGSAINTFAMRYAEANPRKRVLRVEDFIEDDTGTVE